MANVSSDSKGLIRGYDILFKIILIGDTQVGKSSIHLRYAEGTFTITFITTIGKVLIVKI